MFFVDATRIVCEGQARDMEFETRTDVSVDEYMLMIEQKTAGLCFRQVCKLVPL